MTSLRNQIDEIKSKIKISEEISKHIQLVQKGNDLWIEKYSKDKDIDWKIFDMHQFSADWSEVSPKELERLHKLAFFKFYFTKFRVIKFIFALNANQMFKFLKRIMSVLLPSKWYNRLFNRGATDFKYINPFERKIHKN